MLARRALGILRGPAFIRSRSYRSSGNENALRTRRLEPTAMLEDAFLDLYGYLMSPSRHDTTLMKRVTRRRFKVPPRAGRGGVHGRQSRESRHDRA